MFLCEWARDVHRNVSHDGATVPNFSGWPRRHIVSFADFTASTSFTDWNNEFFADSSLESIFNLSVQLSQFPSLWKKAFICLLSKSRTPKSPSKTRLIDSLSVLSQKFERIIDKKITRYVEEFKNFDSKQSGYRGALSTQTPANCRVSRSSAIDTELAHAHFEKNLYT